MKYILAKSAAEALEALLAEEGKARIIAGGSDVSVTAAPMMSCRHPCTGMESTV